MDPPTPLFSGHKITSDDDPPNAGGWDGHSGEDKRAALTISLVKESGARTPSSIEVELTGRWEDESGGGDMSTYNRRVITELCNYCGLSCPDVASVHQSTIQVDGNRRLIMEYVGESLVVITATSYIVIGVRDTSFGALRGWMGPNQKHHWMPRERDETVRADGPIIVTCVVVDGRPTRTTERRSRYMITGMVTDSHGLTITLEHTDEECRASAAVVSTSMGERWGYSSTMRSMMRPVVVDNTGFVSLIDGRPRTVPPATGKTFPDYMVELMSRELMVLSESGKYVLLLDCPTLTTPHLEMLYRKLCVVHLNNRAISQSIADMSFAPPLTTDNMLEGCTAVADLPDVGKYSGDQVICGIITADGMHDRRARVIIDLTCGTNNTDLHKFGRSSMCVSDTPDGCDPTLDWSSVRIGEVMDLNDVCPDGRLGDHDSSDMWICARGMPTHWPCWFCAHLTTQLSTVLYSGWER